MVKRQHTIWLEDNEFRKLKAKVSEFFTGKGSLEKFLRKIINENVIFLKGCGIVKIEVVE